MDITILNICRLPENSNLLQQLCISQFQLRQMPLPGTDKGGQMLRSSLGWWGGGGGVWAQLELTDALFLTDDEALTRLLLEMRTVLYRRTLYLKRPLKKVEEK